VRIEYDPEKDMANRAKHGVGLAFGERVFEDEDVIILPSFRPVDGEDRLKAVGKVDSRLYTAVHVWRGEAVRLIPVRRSNAREQRDYDCNPEGPE